MPRSARLNLPGGLFHAISRFVRDEHVLVGDVERAAYLALLGRALKRTDAKLLAYCLMSSHVHLVVLQGEEPLERLFKRVHTGFAGWVHHRTRRGRKAGGPVVADRPRTVLVEEERYLLELVRYLHNNPVRAGLVRHASQSAWSSHRAYIGKDSAPDWLNIGYVLDRFGAGPARARKELDAFVRAGEKEKRRPELSGEPEAEVIKRTRAVLGDGWRLSDAVLGSEAFASRVAKDVRSARKTLAAGRMNMARGAWERERVPLRSVIDAVLEVLELDPIAFNERPMTTRHQLARQLIVWTWVRQLGGRQIDVVREMNAPTYSVARWYGRAVELASELEELSEAVLHLVTKGRRKAAPKRTPRFRYQVELD